MLKDYLIEVHKKTQQKQTDFYTPHGWHVYFKDALHNDDLNIEKVISRVEGTLPSHLRAEVEMIAIGWFDEFEGRAINAFYKDGALYISNFQDNEADMYDDIVHEIAHSLEGAYGYEIYGDQKVKEEFLRKRKYLHDILWKAGFKVPESFFMNAEYDKEFDKFLYETVGYDKLSNLIQGLFISAYAPTSIEEYFATGFTEFYLDPNHGFLQKVSPELYKKLFLLQKPEKLDSAR